MEFSSIADIVCYVLCCLSFVVNALISFVRTGGIKKQVFSLRKDIYDVANLDASRVDEVRSVLTSEQLEALVNFVSVLRGDLNGPSD